MNEVIYAKSLTSQAFAPFGDVIAAEGRPNFLINRDRCERYHDLARADMIGNAAHAGLSVARSEVFSLPFMLDMMERHPLGSQAFVPMAEGHYLVMVAPDEQGRPGAPLAFIAGPGQGVNYHRNTWHGVLTPLEKPIDFLIVDRIGEGNNLQEFFFEDPYLIMAED